jgi:hypothetical protein
MDEGQLWEAIHQAIESGEEEDTIDLKSRRYNFRSNASKGEFIKDVSAIANSGDGLRFGHRFRRRPAPGTPSA